MKEKIKISIIPTIMVLISIIIAFTIEENIRKILLMLVSFLLGMHIQICIDILKESK